MPVRKNSALPHRVQSSEPRSAAQHYWEKRYKETRNALRGAVPEGPSANAIFVAQAGPRAANRAIIAENIRGQRSRSALGLRAIIVGVRALSNDPGAVVRLVSLTARSSDGAVRAFYVGRSRRRTAVFFAAGLRIGRLPRRVHEVASSEEKERDNPKR